MQRSRPLPRAALAVLSVSILLVACSSKPSASGSGGSAGNGGVGDAAGALDALGGADGAAAGDGGGESDAKGDSDGSSGGGSDGAGRSADGGADSGGLGVVLDKPLPEQSGKWPSKPVRLSDGGLWIPTRTIDDGKGGKLTLQEPPPLIKPERTRLVPGAYTPGVLLIMVRPSAPVAVSGGRFVATTQGADLSSLQAVAQSFGADLGPLMPVFSESPAALAAERLKLEQKTGRALRDLTRFVIQRVHLGADLAAVVDAYNDSPLVELAMPMPAEAETEADPEPVGESTEGDLGRRTRDLTLFQTYLHGSQSADDSAGGLGITYAWSLKGGRGQGTAVAHLETAWNRQHEDVDWANTTLQSTWGGQSQDFTADNAHDMSTLGVMCMRNDGIGMTGIASRAHVHLMPVRDVDELSTWAGWWDTAWNSDSAFWRYAQVIRRLGDVLPAGSFASVSMSLPDPPNRRVCGATTAGPARPCAPRVQCLPPQPWVMDGGNPRMRCEGFPDLDAAANGCANDAECQNRWGFGARCLPVPLPVSGLFGAQPRKWRCGGDPGADECTTSADCALVADCVDSRCGGFTPPAWMAGAGFTVDAATATSGGACASNAGCTIPANALRCTGRRCGGTNALPWTYDPLVNAAIGYASAKGVTLLMAAANRRQRLGLLTDDNVVGRGLVGHDLYKRFYACPFPGCMGPAGGVVVGGTNGEAGAVRPSSSRGPRVDLAAWAGDVATMGLDTTNRLHQEASPGAGNTTNNYRSDFNGTSAATPLVTGMATALQGIVKAATGAPVSGATIIAALAESGVRITAPFHGTVGRRAHLQSAVQWLSSHPPVESPGGANVLPAGAGALGAPALLVTELSSTLRELNATTQILSVAMTVKNAGAQTSPPVGLRLMLGPAGTAAVAPPPAAGTPKVADPAGAQTVGFTCVAHDNPYNCCSGATAAAGCNARDRDGNWVFVPMVDGTATTTGGGQRAIFLEFEVPKAQVDAMGDAPVVCAMLDRYGRNDVGSWLNPGGQAPNLSSCMPVGRPVDAIAISSSSAGKQRLRPYSFAVDPDASLCGAKLVANDSGKFTADIVAVTRRRPLLLSAYPHTGVVGAFDYAACKELDFSPVNPTGSCGAPAGINRLDFTGQTWGADPCSAPELAKKQGRNPMAMALTRDQRFVAVALGNLQDPCQPGKLAFIDLRDPSQPKILREKGPGGIPQNVEIPIGPNPKAIAISHEGQKDARIVVVHDTHTTQCKKAPHASVVKLADALAQGSAAPVASKPFIYKCSGGFCAPRLPQAITIDPDNLAAFVTFKQDGTGSANIKGTGSIGMLRLSDLHANVFFRKSDPDVVSYDRPYGLDAVGLGGGKVRVVFVAETFMQKSSDPTGTTCAPGKACSGLHWHDIDVGASTATYVNSGRLIPDLTAARDVVLSADAKHLLVVANNTKVARYTVGQWTNIKLDTMASLHGGRRIIRMPVADAFCPDEACNGVDDDCDGDTDEDWKTKGDACSVGAGQCAKTGTMVCTDDLLSLRCSATPGAPASEACDGLDNDCDGEIDEPWRHELGSSCSAGQGECRRYGVKKCGGDGVVCSAKAAAAGVEVCNGRDDDCDGQTDEGLTCQPEDPCQGVVCDNGSCQVIGGVATCVCNPGFERVGLRCVKPPTCDVALPKGPGCPDACTGGCLGTTCIVRCSGKDACKDAAIACPKDRPCRIDCIGDGACAGATVACGDGLMCETRCQGTGACAGAALTCGKGLCQVACWHGGGKLASMDCGASCGCAKGCL